MKDRRWEGGWETGKEKRKSWEHKGKQLHKRKTEMGCQKRENGKHKTEKWREKRKYRKIEEKERG